MTKTTQTPDDKSAAFILAEDVQAPSTTERARAVKQSDEGTGETVTGQWVIFSLGNEEYALPIENVREVNRVAQLSRVPNSAAHILGVINLRGRIIPVLDIKQRMRLGATEMTKQSRIVVVEQREKVLGLMVDRVDQVMELRFDSIEPLPEGLAADNETFTLGVSRLANRMLILLDLEQLTSLTTGPNLFGNAR